MKLQELTTLCGIVACAIIFSGNGSSPDIWPSPSEAVIVLEKLKNLPPKKQVKYMMDQESYLTMNISKLNKKLERQRKKIQRVELDLIFSECITGKNLQYLHSWRTMNEIICLLTEQIKFIASRIDCAKSKIKG